MDYVLYHASCQDGWVAAYICKKMWPDAFLLPLSYSLSHQELNTVFECTFQKDVIMVDYSFPTRDLMEQLWRTTKSLRVLDHHISKKDVLFGFDFAIFDNDRSGAGLAWDYLFGVNSTRPDAPKELRPYHREDQPLSRMRPWWVNYTEDQDLWNWKLPDSRIINSFLMIQPRTIEGWNKIETMNVSEAIQIGTGARQHTEFLVQSLLKTVQFGRFFGYRAGVVNTSTEVSEVGEAIYNQTEYYDLALSWYERKSGDVSFGLRSLTVDCGALAKTYGGGGHRESAGFELDLKSARNLLDQVLMRGEYAPITYCG